MRKKRAGNKSFAVFGMGEFGKTVVKELAESGADVLAVDSDEEALKEVMEDATEAVIMDAKNAKAYSRISLADMDAVVIAMAEHMDATIMAVMQSVEAGVDTIIAKALEEAHAKIYQKVGASATIIPEKSEAASVARALTGENIFEYVDLDSDACISEVLVHETWVGKSIRELELMQRLSINIIGKITNKKLELALTADTVLNAGEHLLIAAKKESFEKLYGSAGQEHQHLW